ncbi:MAG: DUF4259 domain-containing protein [Acidimicrobiales bacterium]
MGAWGTGTFDNDDAADWAYELDESADLAPARQALAATMDSDGYLEIPEGACAVAAANVVAASFDGNLKGLPEVVAEWVDRHPDIASRSDARLAADALGRVMSEESELRNLWDDAPEGPEWAEGIEKLRHRLVRAIGDGDEVGAE